MEIKKIQERVLEVKSIMLNNIDKLLLRGEKLEQLKDKTEDLEDESRLFAENAHLLHKKAKNRYLALTFIIIGGSLGAMVALVMGYGLLAVTCAMILGGLAGYLVNALRNVIEDTFFRQDFLANSLLGPTSSEHKKKNNQLQSRYDTFTPLFEHANEGALGLLDEVKPGVGTAIKIASHLR